MTADSRKPTGPAAEPPRKGEAVSKAEQAVRHAPESAVAPREKRSIGAATSREEDA